MAESGEEPQEQRSIIMSGRVLNIDDLNKLVELLQKHQMQDRTYYMLGLRLGLSHNKLSNIERDYEGDNRRCIECLASWLRKAKDVEEDPTIDILVAALRGIGETAVADGIDRERKGLGQSERPAALATLENRISTSLSSSGQTQHSYIIPALIKNLYSEISDKFALIVGDFADSVFEHNKMTDVKKFFLGRFRDCEVEEVHDEVNLIKLLRKHSSVSQFHLLITLAEKLSLSDITKRLDDFKKERDVLYSRILAVDFAIEAIEDHKKSDGNNDITFKVAWDLTTTSLREFEIFLNDVFHSSDHKNISLRVIQQSLLTFVCTIPNNLKYRIRMFVSKHDTLIKSKGVVKITIGTDAIFNIEKTCYAGIIFKKLEGIIDFTAVPCKRLNHVLKYIKGKFDSSVQIFYFCFESSYNFLELHSDQNKLPTIEPLSQPCRLYRNNIDNIGIGDYSFPTCTVSLHGTATEIKPHYSVLVEGITLFIDPLKIIISSISLSFERYEKQGQLENYLTKAKPVAVISAFDEGGAIFLTGCGGEYVYRETSDFDAVFEDIPESLHIKPFEKKISHEVFWDIILKEKVPVVTGLIAVMGLPSSGKTTVLKSFLRQKIKLKPEAKLGIDYYLNKKRDEHCLSIYDLCFFGSSQHNKYAWSFATNRYGAIISILCHLIHHNPYVTDIKFEVTSQSPKSIMDRHIRWLMGRTQHVLERIKDEPSKLTLIQNGLSFINVMDVGVNKALYDFLSIMLLSCHRHIRLAFFSLNRDAPNLEKKPDLPSVRYGVRKDDVLVMQQRSRLTYLLHFATVGYTQQQRNVEEVQNATVMVATRNELPKDPMIVGEAKHKIIKQAQSRGVDQFLKNWLEVDVNDDKSIEKFGEKMEDLIKYKYKQRTLLLPLRWIVLRSLVVSLDNRGAKVIILRRSFIMHKAKELQMTENDVDEFLKTFTDFGSILYMPQYDAVKDIVIVNIWEFTQYLNKLYYPQEGESYAPNLLKYGIISESSVKEIFCKHPQSAEDFMTVLTTIAMASKIESGRAILIDGQQQPDEVHYYLPLARTREVYIPSEEENDYAFIEIQSVNFPANVQAGISYAIMDNNEDAVLIATEHSNVSRFLFRSESGSPITIEMICKGSRTRFRITNNSKDILTSPAAVEACYKVITASCQCLDRKINTIRDLKYSFAVPRASPEGECHSLYYDCEPQFCDACSAENNFRLCWSKAAKKCELLKKGQSEARTSENNLLKFQDISSIITNEYDFDAFKKALNIDESKFPGLSSPEDEEGRKKAMMLMLLLWERQTDKPTKHALIDKLKENGFDDIAERLKNTSNTS